MVPSEKGIIDINATVKFRNFNGKDVDGSVVMVDFNCAAEWMNASGWMVGIWIQ